MTADSATHARDPLAAVVRAAMGHDAHAEGLLNGFHRERTLFGKLVVWLALTRPPERAPRTARALLNLLHRDIARIDAILSEQLDAILHAPAFQGLEAGWRGLKMLTDCADDVRSVEGTGIKIRVLDLSWRALVRDLERAMEFDQSQLFRKIYGNEFDMPGGEPFGVLLGHYEVRHRPGPGHPTNDLGALETLSAIGAAAFAPILVGADPAFLGLDGFRDLEIAQDLPRTFDQAEYIKWKSFRKREDARFLGITLPRTLMRLPHADDGSRDDGFRYSEDASAPDRSGHLWGPATFAFGTVLIRAFADCGWLADIRGAPTDGWAGGIVTHLPHPGFTTDAPGIAPRYATDVLITDDLEKELGDLGFIPLCQLPGTRLAVFYGNQSVQSPQSYDTDEAAANARLSAMLQYLFCVARFAHYLKIMVRDKVGSFTTADSIERHLRNWVLQYCTASDDLGMATRAKYPLREASVKIREVPGRPGKYGCVMHLKPHYQLDQVVSAVRLVTELAPLQV